MDKKAYAEKKALHIARHSKQFQRSNLRLLKAVLLLEREKLNRIKRKV